MELKLWSVMAVIYLVGYYLRGLRQLRRRQPSNHQQLFLPQRHRQLLLSALRCAALSMAALIGVQIIADSDLSNDFIE